MISYDYAETLLPLFLEKTSHIPYQDYGILPLEAFSLYVFCKSNEIHILIESGTANGYSTEVLANVIPECKIITIDSNQNYGSGMQNSTKNRLAYLTNITFLTGNSFDLIDSIIQDNKDLNIGTFIDGPKGSNARLLANQTLKHNNIKFSSCHDQMQANSNYLFCPNLDATFKSKFEFINDKINQLPSVKDKFKTIKQEWPDGMGIILFNKPI